MICILLTRIYSTSLRYTTCTAFSHLSSTFLCRDVNILATFSLRNRLLRSRLPQPVTFHARIYRNKFNYRISTAEMNHPIDLVPLSIASPPPTDWIGSVVANAVLSKELDSIYKAAIQDKDLGPDKLYAELRHLILLFAQELEWEDTEFWIVAETMGDPEVADTGALAVTMGDAAVADAEASVITGRNAAAELEPEHAALLLKIIDSDSYINFGRRVLNLVLGAHGRRIVVAIGTVVIGEDNKVLQEDQRIAAVDQLMITPPHLISSIPYGAAQFSLFQRFQALIEDCTGKKCNWWSLRPRVYNIWEGFSRLQWSTMCGEPRHIDISESRVSLVEDVFASAPEISVLARRRFIEPVGGLAIGRKRVYRRYHEWGGTILVFAGMGISVVGLGCHVAKLVASSKRK